MSRAIHVTIRRAFALGNAALSILLLAVGLGLPTRYWPVDLCLGLMSGLSGLSAFGLLRGRPWGGAVLRVSAACDLCVGLLALSALALAVSYFGGIYSDLGRSALAFWLVGSLIVVPYLVVYPALQLLWLHAARASTS